ncbi:hypothetical protein BDQ94DRAFT_143126 [Aspergillus welwitschiae]|uniref:Uncharacterized protein n=1 Tax=Aspergillus welwitschiae TaxID=1341132 RepID=A0A3F3Q350_9EURO|nr:hypothetical protein BDQ94DRAFT_143126 [Aspergillus welwitschiae]RDH33437.1 hypothetical protein BDQ94DRAFT_143126 [Aspergillus welwitschiae]
MDLDLTILGQMLVLLANRLSEFPLVTLFSFLALFSVFQEGKSIVVPLCSYERGTQLTRGHMANNGLQRRQRRCSRLWQDRREGRTPSNRQTALGPCLGRLSSAIIRSAPLEPNSH